MELPARRKRGRAQRTFMDVVKQDLQRVGVTEEDAGIVGGNPPWRPLQAAGRRQTILHNEHFYQFYKS